MADIHHQLQLFGVDKVVEDAHAEGANKREIARIHNAFRTLSNEDDGISFLHSGFCMAAMPHRKPADDSQPWIRSNGRFHLAIKPGGLIRDGRWHQVGIPYGAKARLIMVWLQSEGMKNREVPLNASMSAWMRSLGLQVTGGAKGTIKPVREQTLRLSRAEITMQWDGAAHEGTIIRDQRLIEGLHLWAADPNEGKWPEKVVLSSEFHEHLREHAVPLSDMAIASLKGSSLALDIYVWLAHRLPRLDRISTITWKQMQMQFGSDMAHAYNLASKVRDILPDVLAVYPDARVDVGRHGLIIAPSKPAVPKARIFIQRRIGLVEPA
ncbi:MAG: replication protein RepA [Pseudomonadota bacterium]|nr:replication protein RepA [Pseudomonadota bacterium]